MLTRLQDRIETARMSAASGPKKPPLRGRSTIRRNGSVTGATGQISRAIKRWSFDPKPELARLEASYFVGISAVDRAEEFAASSKASGKFTPEGVRDHVLNFALKNLVPDLHKARMTIKRVRAEVAERKSRLKIETPFFGDVASAMRRREIRDFLRAMDAAQQAEYFASRGDNLSAEVLDAVIEMEPEFSGVSLERHGQLRQRALSTLYGPETAEIAELEEAVSVAEMAVELARDEVRLEIGGIPPNEFDALAAPIEAKHAAPWLRRRNGTIHLVDMERRVERVPSDEELATGILADNYDAYRNAQTAVPTVE
jgi:hypothetical protein